MAVRIEVPPGYVEVSNLLRAVERSLRSRSLSRRLFVSTDRTYVARRAISSPKAKRKVKQEDLPGHGLRPPLREIIDWPQISLLRSHKKRKVEHENDEVLQYADEVAIEVHEPDPQSTREKQLALLLPQTLCSVKDDWTAPAGPDRSTSLQSGTKFTLLWKSGLRDWFPTFCAKCDTKKLDLWIENTGNGTKYFSKIASE